MEDNNIKIDSIKEEQQEEKIILKNKKKIVIALPGNNYSSKFIISWTSTINKIWELNKYDIIVSPGVSSFVPFARMQTLGLDVLRGKDQKPFNGLDYDVWISIDSDIIYTPEQVIELVEATDKYGVVAGIYRMEDLVSYPVVKDWDNEYFKKNGTFKFLKQEDIEKYKEENKEEPKYMEVSYTGMGFFAMKSEILTKMSYPYFNGDLEDITLDDGNIVKELCSEDVNFCKNIKKAGYKIYVNVDLRVGHNKSIVI